MASPQPNSEERICPACGHASARSRGYKNDLQLVSCESCDTLYTSRVGGDAQLDYDDYYTAANLAVPAFIDGRLDEIVGTFEPYRKNNRLLDVGCGGGSFLEAAVRSNWEAHGVEVSRTAAEHIRARGLQVFCGELEKADYPEGHFDVVILSEVLEHVPNPGALLASSARVLRPGGLLWGTTPHGRGISARLLDLGWSTVCPPEHLQLFSIGGIRQLFTSVGFGQIEVATHGTNPYEIIHGLRRTAEPRSSGAVVESGEAFKRVESSYQLNEKLSGGGVGRFVKATLNGLLNTMRIGDSLKIRARKSGLTR